jgi:hypothetical protein
MEGGCVNQRNNIFKGIRINKLSIEGCQEWRFSDQGKSGRR